MKYLLPKNWSNCIKNDGILYFAQRLEEMLFNYTIDLYRMPLLNTHGLADEYCDVENILLHPELGYEMQCRKHVLED